MSNLCDMIQEERNTDYPLNIAHRYHAEKNLWQEILIIRKYTIALRYYLNIKTIKKDFPDTPLLKRNLSPCLYKVFFSITVIISL